MPNTTVDPIVIAARTVVALQTIVAREVKPGEVAVVTIGYIQAGTKNNIIPDQADLGLTVRSYKPEVRKQVLAAIDRITKAEANAAGATREPKIEHYEATDAVYNDPALAQRMEGVLYSALGKDNVVVEEPGLASEDFSYFTAQGVPSFYFAWVERIPRNTPKPRRQERLCLPTTLHCSLRMWTRRCTPGSRLRSQCCVICCSKGSDFVAGRSSRCCSRAGRSRLHAKLRSFSLRIGCRCRHRPQPGPCP